MVDSKIKEFYNNWSPCYEQGRDRGYFQLIYELEMGLLENYIGGKRVLEAGCGTGLILDRIRQSALRSVGIDFSWDMLAISKGRNLEVVQGEIANLPFKDGAFDVACSFKVLPHVREITKAMDELSKVIKKGGYLVLEFYNFYSIRGINTFLMNGFARLLEMVGIKRYPSNYNRYDSYWAIKKIIPKSFKIERTRGIRIFTPCSLVYRIPFLSSIFKSLERNFCETILKYFAGFFIVVLKKM